MESNFICHKYITLPADNGKVADPRSILAKDKKRRKMCYLIITWLSSALRMSSSVRDKWMVFDVNKPKLLNCQPFKKGNVNKHSLYGFVNKFEKLHSSD